LTPLEALYSYPPSLQTVIPQNDSGGSCHTTHTIETREETSYILQTNLVKAQAPMKWYADFKRMDKQYQVGDLVYLKIEPYKKKSLYNTNFHKLAAKF